MLFSVIFFRMMALPEKELKHALTVKCLNENIIGITMSPSGQDTA